MMSLLNNSGGGGGIGVHQMAIGEPIRKYGWTFLIKGQINKFGYAHLKDVIKRNVIAVIYVSLPRNG